MSFQFIDSDRHVSEPMWIWQEYLSKDFEDYIPYHQPPVIAKVPDYFPYPEKGGNTFLPPEIYVQGEPLFHQWGKTIQIEIALKSKKFASIMKKGGKPELQIQAMDESQVQAGALFPTFAMLLVYNDRLPPDVSVAFSQAYNNWLFDYCSYHSKRLLGIGLISRSDPTSMLEELQRIAHFGWKSIVFCPNMVMGRTLGHPDYDPFWKACETMDIGIALHGITHLNLPTAGIPHFKSHFALHACSHSLEAQMAFLALLEGGVFERYPQLKFAFLEAGASYMLPWLWRLDEICYGSMPGELADRITMKPSEYFKRQCWISFESTEPCLRQVADSLGADRLLFCTDFPHPDHLHFDLQELKRRDYPLNSEELDLALEKNPKTFFGI